MTVIRVLDFETTGLPPDAAICEAGWYDLDPSGEPWLDGAASSLINPGRPMPPEASAVHHLIDEDVDHAPSKEDVFQRLMDGADIFAAHSAAFEKAFFGGGDKPWICTLKAARRVWPEAPSHSNQALRYWLRLPISRTAAEPAHRALPDAYVTAWLLHELLRAGTSLDDMIQWTKEPSLLPRVTFGKHRGKAWSELPLDYLDWLVGKSDMDEDTKFTARHWLRKAAA